MKEGQEPQAEGMRERCEVVSDVPSPANRAAPLAARLRHRNDGKMEENPPVLPEPPTLE